ncbi:amidohydrolase family protein [Tepidiforma sp.]|uniref:amidohydrolase family protein n=1 Tax=Tepidiforma sp. TaxID=2682230 RepID=UPI002ADE26CA|nr:amidohydrolase family protein [Tepidiforma sp.]
MDNRVDAHTHLFAPAQIAARVALSERDPTFAELYADPRAKLADAPALRTALDRAGIGRAVAAGFAFASPRDLAEQAEYLLAVAAESNGAIAALPCLNLADPGWERDARRWLARGARGFGELRPGNQGWDPLGPEAIRLAHLAAESGAVLLWHVSEPLGHAYPGKRGGIGPIELAELAARAPSARMVAAHLGGGLSFYLQMPEVRRAIENIYFDTAAAFLLYDEWSVARLVDLAGPGRVLFGSDFPLLAPRRQLERILAGLPPATAPGVCGGNAATLYFGLPSE